MKITIEIPDEEIKDAVLNVVAQQYYKNYSTDRRNVDRVVSECVRKVIYEDKERITDRIVSQASSHLKNVALKKMMEKMTED
ncbi:MAG TPA: hypothetical protein H9722_01205 [Candidatus Mediterraneibacter pullistercoris]|nr:hypothetical protein [Candidatus Mediterraneibacter pullistercoris]